MTLTATTRWNHHSESPTTRAELNALRPQFRAAAGDDFRWSRATDWGFRSVRTDEKRGLLLWMLDYADHTCAACGLHVSAPWAEICHLVASARPEYGVVPGNVYAGHRACNVDESDRRVVPFYALPRLDVIPTGKPARRDLLRLDADYRAAYGGTPLDFRGAATVTWDESERARIGAERFER